jgi:hypothetical protein
VGFWGVVQGDRRASGSARHFQTFNLETKYGHRALEAMFDILKGRKALGANITPPALTDQERVAVHYRLDREARAALGPSYLGQPLDNTTFKEAGRLWLRDVGVDVVKDAPGSGRNPKSGKVDVGRFLNRLLGLQIHRQTALLSLFLQVSPTGTACGLRFVPEVCRGNMSGLIPRPSSFTSLIPLEASRLSWVGCLRWSDHGRDGARGQDQGRVLGGHHRGARPRRVLRRAPPGAPPRPLHGIHHPALPGEGRPRRALGERRRVPPGGEPQ